MSQESFFRKVRGWAARTFEPDGPRSRNVVGVSVYSCQDTLPIEKLCILLLYGYDEPLFHATGRRIADDGGEEYEAGLGKMRGVKNIGWI